MVVERQAGAPPEAVFTAWLDGDRGTPTARRGPGRRPAHAILRLTTASCTTGVSAMDIGPRIVVADVAVRAAWSA